MNHSKPLVLIVTGSRHCPDGEYGGMPPYEIAVRKALMDVKEERGSNVVLLVGGQLGVDRYAELFGRQMRWSVWSLGYVGCAGIHGGPLRNKHLVLNATSLAGELCADLLCKAFPGPSSSGTWDCVNKCKAACIRVDVHEVGL